MNNVLNIGFTFIKRKKLKRKIDLNFEKDTDSFQRNFLYVTIFTSGAVVLALEILGSRILAPFYGSTIFVWSALISVALGFLALGYFLGGKIADKYPYHSAFYLIVGFAAGLVIGIYQFKRVIIVFSDNFGLQYGPLSASILFFAIPFTIFGTVSPYVIRLLTNDVKTSGSSSGKVFAISTAGSLIGALAVSFILIPKYPVGDIIYAVSILLIVLSLIGFILSDKPKNMTINFRMFFVILLAIFLVGGYLKKGNWPSVNHQLYETEVVYQENNFYGESTVIGIPRAVDGRICFLVDSSVQSCIDPRNKDEVTPYEKMIAMFRNLPENSEVLILGLGGGQLFREYDDDKFRFDLVDINPVSPEAIKIAGIKLPTKHNIITEDARIYLRKTEKKYDVVFVDLFNNVSPVAHMLSVEALELLSERLKVGGILIMSHTGKTDGGDILANSAINGLKKYFKNVYTSSDHPDEFFSYVLLMASNKYIDVVPMNQYIEGRNKKSNLHLATFSKAEQYFSGLMITDDYNPSDYLWTNNLIQFETIESFRNKYKRLNQRDFM